MNITKRTRLIAVGAVLLLLTPIAMPQIMKVIKVLGVGAAVKQFAPDINKAINKLTKHTDTPTKTTKVVPILVVGVSSNSAIGAAQVSGPKSAVDKVQAVASPETRLFGNEIRVRAMIPVSKADFKDGFKTVDGVAVTGIVDLKL